MSDNKKEITVVVNPGICGLLCRIRGTSAGSRAAGLEISGSECQQIRRLSELVKTISLKELFLPITKNPIYISAQAAGCHPSCPVPAAIIKTAEAAMGMAIPKDARITFFTGDETRM